jgi:hypothetical protein
MCTDGIVSQRMTETHTRTTRASSLRARSSPTPGPVNTVLGQCAVQQHSRLLRRDLYLRWQKRGVLRAYWDENLGVGADVERIVVHRFREQWAGPSSHDLIPTENGLSTVLRLQKQRGAAVCGISQIRGN